MQNSDNKISLNVCVLIAYLKSVVWLIKLMFVKQVLCWLKRLCLCMKGILSDHIITFLGGGGRFRFRENKILV